MLASDTSHKEAGPISGHDASPETIAAAALLADRTEQCVTRGNWRTSIAVVLAVCFWVIAWYADTFRTMAGVWWNSATFAHGIVVYPIAAWLIWRSRATVAALRPEPCYWAILPMAACGLGWLVAFAGGVQAGQHLCAVLLLALLPWAVLGTAVAHALAFPLVFTLFAVPIGDFMLPVLMDHTADFTVVALRFTGIPVYREGLNFSVPSGNWSVVEACSGLRYLIASMMLGSLFAYLTYRTIWRRVAFIALSIVVPIIANWVRAYMIVMIGHLSSMTLAVGVDHLIYGWLFFGLIMFLLFWIGSGWREDVDAPAASNDSDPAPAAAPAKRGQSVSVGAIAAALSVIVWPVYAHTLKTAFSGDAVTLSVPVPASGWTQLAEVPSSIRPHYSGERSKAHVAYGHGDAAVGIFMAYYYAQSHGSELIAFDNVIARNNDHHWIKVANRRVEVPPAGFRGVETQLRSARENLLVWQWYWIGGRWTASEEEAKLIQALMTLIGRGDDSAVVVLHTQIGSEDVSRARARLAEFSRGMLPRIESSFSNARDARVAAGSTR